jgi:hypothetical protein
MSHLITACSSKNVQFIIPVKYQQTFESTIQPLNAIIISTQGYGEEVKEGLEEREEDVKKS